MGVARAALLLFVSPAWCAVGIAQAGPGGALSELTRVRPGRSRRISSAAPTAGSNRDNLRIKPGKTRVLADISGPANVTHIWLTFGEARPNRLSREGSANPSEVVLRMYWGTASARR